MSLAIGIGLGIPFVQPSGGGLFLSLANATGSYLWSGVYDGSAFSGAETLPAGSSLALSFSNIALLTSLNVTDNALTQTSVDQILAALVSGGGINGTLSIDGTNSAPSTTGIANADILTSRGWTVAITGGYSEWNYNWWWW